MKPVSLRKLSYLLESYCENGCGADGVCMMMKIRLEDMVRVSFEF